MAHLRSKIFRLSILAVSILLCGVLFLVRTQSPSGVPKKKQSSPPLTSVQRELNRLFQEGSKAYNLADLVGAEKAWSTGLEKAQISKDMGREAIFLDGLGYVYFDLNQLDKAKDYYNRAFTIEETLGDEQDAAKTLDNLGNVCKHLGQFENTLDYYTRSLAIKEKKGDEKDIAYGLDYLGDAYSDLNLFDKAVVFHTRSLLIREKSGAKWSSATSIYRLGTDYFQLGQFEKSRYYFHLLLDIDEKQGNPEYIANCFEKLGMVYIKLGAPKVAQHYIMRAITLNKKVGNSHYVITALNDLGSTFREAGQIKEAQDFFTRALAIAEKHGNPMDRAIILNNMGEICWELGQIKKAQDYFTRALAIAEKHGNPMDRAVNLIGLGHIYEQQGKLDQAEDAFNRVLNTYESVSQHVAQPEQLGAFQDSIANIYSQFAYLLILRKQPAKALAMTERGRMQGLARKAGENQIIFTGFQSMDAHQWKDVNAQFIATERRLYTTRMQTWKLIERNASAEEVKSANQQGFDALRHFIEAESNLTTLRSQLDQRYPDFQQRRGSAPVSLNQFETLTQKNPTTLYLEYVTVAKNTTLLFAISKRDGLQTFTLPVGYKYLHKLIGDWLTDISVAPPFDAADEKHARACFDALLGPVEKSGLLQKAEHLVIVGEGPILDVPFAALMDKQGKRLVERLPLSYTFSLSSLLWTDKPKNPTTSFLCVADPFGNVEKIAQNHEEPERIRSAQFRGESMDPLPNARKEGEVLSKLIPGAKLFTGDKATILSIQSEMSNCALLHFATHGFANGDNGFLSFLTFADGTLSARDIAGLHLSAQLAVLSACRTARGQKSGGEGLLGLSWAFRAAGCPSLVVSQWSVEDEATGQLMEVFYRGLLKGLSKDEALRIAVLSIQHAKGRPFYWAAFQVMGDTSSISLSK